MQGGRRRRKRRKRRRRRRRGGRGQKPHADHLNSKAEKGGAIQCRCRCEAPSWTVQVHGLSFKTESTASPAPPPPTSTPHPAVAHHHRRVYWGQNWFYLLERHLLAALVGPQEELKHGTRKLVPSQSHSIVGSWGMFSYVLGCIDSGIPIDLAHIYSKIWMWSITIDQPVNKGCYMGHLIKLPLILDSIFWHSVLHIHNTAFNIWIFQQGIIIRKVGKLQSRGLKLEFV